MKIAILKERRPGERRVAASPEVVKKLIALGAQVAVEAGAGEGSAFTDDAYRAAGGAIAPDAKAAVGDADMVWKVRAPEGAEIGVMKKGAMLVAHMAALTDRAGVKACADAGLTVFAMELMPRITRAQSMDILSSQSNLAGYRAVIDAAGEFARGFPMMMTAAGTVPPAKIFIMGVGVAGLQAIATAKRMGAVVTAYDVRAATKEQVESLGGKFVVVDEEAMKTAQTAGGYAKEMGEDYKKKEQAVISEHIKKQDIVITTALIPGKKAPILVSEEMVKSMAPGSVVVDLAVEAGGNCACAELDKVAVKHGVKIVGHGNMPSRIAADASALFARNLLNFLTPLVDKQTKALNIQWDDEIIKGTLVAKDGRIVNPMLVSGGN
ncbi:MAG: Re/Si-specific NAD(P)(+) transhydrogenase subunit alpha [Alphaproteobacteria bacterium]|nr:Re/Si-specific NAD(P)(+) transhydrogenase subunit alpha [Alphaproteobacteria bacterium]